MFRQALVAPSRALRSTAHSVAQRPLARSQTFITPIAVRRIQPAAARWYSETTSQESQKKDGDAETRPASEGQDAPAESVEDPVVAELKKKLETKEKEAADWRDKCLRSVADFRNLQDRTQREINKARDYAIQPFAKDLVDSVDNLDRALSMVQNEKLDQALSTVEKDEKALEAKSDEEKTEKDLSDELKGLVIKDLANLYEGLKMTDNILINTLKKHGLERFDPQGEKFNPNEHDAAAVLPQPDKEDNTVFFVQQKGFKLNNRVLRAAKVGVVKNK